MREMFSRTTCVLLATASLFVLTTDSESTTKEYSSAAGTTVDSPTIITVGLIANETTTVGNDFTTDQVTNTIINNAVPASQTTSSTANLTLTQLAETETTTSTLSIPSDGLFVNQTSTVHNDTTINPFNTTISEGAVTSTNVDMDPTGSTTTTSMSETGIHATQSYHTITSDSADTSFTYQSTTNGTQDTEIYTTLPHNTTTILSTSMKVTTPDTSMTKTNTVVSTSMVAYTWTTQSTIISNVTGVTGVQSNTTSTENTAQSTPSTCNVIAFDNASDFNFYYGSKHGDKQLKTLDYCAVNRITPIPIFGNYHNLLYVCDHGIVSFNNSYTYYIPSLLTNAQGLSLLAAYHSDSDPQNPCSVLYYHIYDAAIKASISNEHNVRTAEALVKMMTGRTSFTATFLLVVTWHKILYYPSSQQNPNHTVSYQLVLVSDGRNTYTMYKYFPGEMKFNRSIDVFIGYMFTTGEYFQHPLSFTPNALRIDQYVETKGVKGILFYPLTHEVKNTIEDQRFEFGQNIGDQSLSNVDDNCTEVQNSYRIPLFTNLRTKTYVCSNGIVTFDKPFTAPSLQKNYNPKKTKIDMLMPYLTDIQIISDGQIYYQLNDVSKDRDFRKRPNVINAESIVRELKTNTRYFEAQFLLVVTWLRARPYDAVKRYNETMSFQLVLVSDGLDTYCFYIYFQDEMHLLSDNVFIGYVTQTGEYVKHMHSNTPLARDISTKAKANGRTGIIFYQLTDAPYQENIYRHKCIKWYARNSPGRQIYSNAMTQLPECPCTLDWLRSDPRYVGLSLRQGEAECSYLRFSWWFNPSGVGKTCCYSNSSDHHFLQSGPYAGGFVRYHPWLFYNWHVQEDLQMREYCCDREDLCDLYHAVRPIGTCYTTFPLRFAIFWGDPHIDTLDGRKYTFNGLGEYTLINMESGNTTFVLQARTARVEKKDGNLSDATIFSAFAAKDDRNVHINVELNRTKNGLLVFVNTGSGVNFDDYTIPLADESFPFTVNNENVSLLRTDETKAFQAVFSSGISMTVTLGMRMLSIAVVIPITFSGKTKGLLGNFDGNDTNEFICANGTLLENTIQEREIFQFGQSWRTSENESIFRYPTGKGHADFTDPTFIPKFLDEADPENVANAKKICGEENQECIFDLVFTENEGIAQETLQIEKKASQDQIKIDNKIPSIEGPDILQAVLNKTVTYSLNATDDGTLEYKFLSNDVGAMLTVNEDHTANVSFTVTDVSPVVISVVAEDDAGVQSLPSEPVILFCTGCNGHGICNFSIYSENSQATAKFKYSECECDSPWSGPNCEEDYDSCASFPCSSLRNCTDIPADMHKLTGIGYNCSDCPSGYNLNESQKCQDINECLIKHDCNQSCQNTEGTYVCSCSSGFRLHSDGKTCQDIDECSEATSKCDQICTNTAGGYNCSCYGGFTYNSTSQQCLLVTVSSACMQLNCTQASGCATNSDGNATCFCKIGYHLTNDGVHCKDDDECTQNACQQVCHNTVGSYQCACYAGYKLDSDKKTCKPCDILTFGENCSQTCECGQGVERCDPVKGCVCKAGWTGSTCEMDVNECNEPNVCANAFNVCVNTNGSYECNCVSGYIKDENGTCIDINECLDPVLNLCEQICVNTPGAFFCSCNTGFTIRAENKTNCIDIDECSNGQSGCQHICKNTAGKFACDCYYGYSLAADRKTCDPVEDPCSTYSNLNCSHICLLIENSTSCSCNQGFELMADQQTCRDIDECSNATLNKCTQKDNCLNTNGGYICSCNVGYRLDNDGRTCIECGGYNYGPNCSIPCNCGVGAKGCNPVKGCICAEGWGGETCSVDKNECNAVPSPCLMQNSVCINTNGAHICSCKPGYKNSTSTCQDVNECDDPLLNECAQVCINTNGSYACECHPGFIKDGFQCIDIDECSGPKNNCTHSCENTPGSYRCTCNAGFKLNVTDKRTCIHINECGNDPCDDICVNTLGSYICRCSTGKVVASDDTTCVDCPDGTYGEGCNNICACNVSNSEHCSKDTGKCLCRLGWSGSACDIDINECLNNSLCPLNSICHNNIGSYVCTCTAGFMMSSAGYCQECDSKHYGIDCGFDCTCITWNTEQCNKQNGTCKCLSGWTGQSCEKDFVANSTELPLTSPSFSSSSAVAELTTRIQTNSATASTNSTPTTMLPYSSLSPKQSTLLTTPTSLSPITISTMITSSVSTMVTAKTTPIPQITSAVVSTNTKETNAATSMTATSITYTTLAPTTTTETTTATPEVTTVTISTKFAHTTTTAPSNTTREKTAAPATSTEQEPTTTTTTTTTTPEVKTASTNYTKSVPTTTKATTETTSNMTLAYKTSTMFVSAITATTTTTTPEVTTVSTTSTPFVTSPTTATTNTNPAMTTTTIPEVTISTNSTTYASTTAKATTKAASNMTIISTPSTTFVNTKTTSTTPGLTTASTTSTPFVPPATTTTTTITSGMTPTSIKSTMTTQTTREMTAASVTSTPMEPTTTTTTAAPEVTAESTYKTSTRFVSAITATTTTATPEVTTVSATSTPFVPLTTKTTTITSTTTIPSPQMTTRSATSSTFSPSPTTATINTNAATTTTTTPEVTISTNSTTYAPTTAKATTKAASNMTIISTPSTTFVNTTTTSTTPELRTASTTSTPFVPPTTTTTTTITSGMTPTSIKSTMKTQTTREMSAASAISTPMEPTTSTTTAAPEVTEISTYKTSTRFVSAITATTTTATSEVTTALTTSTPFVPPTTKTTTITSTTTIPSPKMTTRSATSSTFSPSPTTATTNTNAATTTTTTPEVTISTNSTTYAPTTAKATTKAASNMTMISRPSTTFVNTTTTSTTSELRTASTTSTPFVPPTTTTTTTITSGMIQTSIKSTMTTQTTREMTAASAASTSMEPTTTTATAAPEVTVVSTYKTSTRFVSAITAMTTNATPEVTTVSTTSIPFAPPTTKTTTTTIPSPPMTTTSATSAAFSPSPTTATTNTNAAATTTTTPEVTISTNSTTYAPTTAKATTKAASNLTMISTPSTTFVNTTNTSSTTTTPELRTASTTSASFVPPTTTTTTTNTPGMTLTSIKSTVTTQITSTSFGTSKASTTPEQTTKFTSANLLTTKILSITTTRTTMNELPGENPTLSTTKEISKSCMNNTFGTSCESICQCNGTNAQNALQTCDPLNGTCKCKSGWSDDCSRDIDECATLQGACLSRNNTGCHNTLGGYNCSCLIGFELNASQDCIPAQEEITTVTNVSEGQMLVRCSATFDIQITDSTNLNVKETYQYYELNLKLALEAFYGSHLRSTSVTIIIRSIKKGSLIVDYNIIINRLEEVITDLTKANSDLASGQTVLIGGINSTAKEVSVGDVKIPTDVNVEQQMCIAYVAINGDCQDSFVCVVEDGKPRCKFTGVSDTSTLLIGLGIGIPLGLIAVVIVVMVVRYLRIRNKEKDSFALENRYECSDRLSLPRPHVTCRYTGRPLSREDPESQHGSWSIYRRPPMSSWSGYY